MSEVKRLMPIYELLQIHQTKGEDFIKYLKIFEAITERTWPLKIMRKVAMASMLIC
jgi:hypothetical protein